MIGKTKEEYKAEGLRRMKLRKQIRNDKFREMVSDANESGIPFSGIKYGSWPDSNSPTGYSQRCEWPAGSTCQSPCNGDC